ncbi:MAG: aminoglycoside 6'-N-acetyltransferase [Gemmatimonadales bacterium]
MITIRPLASSDTARWVAQRCDLWPDEDPTDLLVDARRFFAGEDELLEAVLVAQHSTDGVVGFVELSRRPYAEGCTTSPVAFLEAWYVAPGHRREGIGGALVAAAEGWARARGCREFASDALVGNEASALAHRALGFEEVEVIRCFRKELGAGNG